MRDGLIRARDLGDDSVTSRVISTDLHSDNYDGSLTDPETVPGTDGWAIFKTLGLVVANNAIFRGKVLASEIIGGLVEGVEIVASIIRGGTISGGTVNIEPDGALTVGDLVTLDATGLTVGDAPVVVDDTGLRVGADVEVDSTGLQVIGGYVTPVWVDRQVASASSGSFTTTESTILSATVTPPAWVQRIWVSETRFVRVSGLGSTADIFVRLNAGDGNYGETVGNPIPSSTAVKIAQRTGVSQFTTGFPRTFNLRAQTSTGTATIVDASLDLLTIGTRT